MTRTRETQIVPRPETRHLIHQDQIARLLETLTDIADEDGRVALNHVVFAFRRLLATPGFNPERFSSQVYRL